MRHRLRSAAATIAALACLRAAQAAGPASPAEATASARLEMSTCTAFAEASKAMRTTDDRGDVQMQFVIASDGRVLSSEITHYTTSLRQARITRRLFSECRFSPAIDRGVAVQAPARLKIAFGSNVSMAGPNRSTCPIPEYRDFLPEGAPLVTRVRLTFAVDGTVTEAAVEESSGRPDLDAVAVAAFAKCRFDPAAEGRPAFQPTAVQEIRWAN